MKVITAFLKDHVLKYTYYRILYNLLRELTPVSEVRSRDKTLNNGMFLLFLQARRYSLRAEDIRSNGWACIY